MFAPLSSISVGGESNIGYSIEVQSVTPHEHITDHSGNGLNELSNTNTVDGIVNTSNIDACNNHDSCNQCVGCVFSLYSFSVDCVGDHNFNRSASCYIIIPQANYRPPRIT